jgi:hypothetical protein
MPKPPTAEMIAESLTVPERVLLFCIASATDWQKAGVTHATARQMLVRGLIDRQAAGSFTLTDQGRGAGGLDDAGGDERVRPYGLGHPVGSSTGGLTSMAMIHLLADRCHHATLPRDESLGGTTFV